MEKKIDHVVAFEKVGSDRSASLNPVSVDSYDPIATWPESREPSRTTSWKSTERLSAAKAATTNMVSKAKMRWSELMADARGMASRSGESVRANAITWGSVAAGVGFGLGLVGRFARHHRERSGTRPQLLIVGSSACDITV